MDIPSIYDHPTKTDEPPSITSSTSTLTDVVNSNTPSEPTTTTTETTTETTITPSNSNPLDQEINELKKTFGGVSASLGGWWGKVQKQSVEVLNSTNIGTQINNARKDLVSLNLIEKAKKEVERIGEQAKESYTIVQTELNQGPDLNSLDGRLINVDGLELLPPSTSVTEPIKGKEKEIENDNNGFDSSSISSFFSKLSKDSEKLTSSIQSKLSNLPSTSNVRGTGKVFDLGEVQKLAEGYLAKGETYLQDVGKELRVIVQDAVKVIPPIGDSTTVDSPLPNSIIQQEVGSRKALDTKRDASISRLRRDSNVLLVDPTTEESSSSTFSEFCDSIQAAGGIEGEAWQKKITEQLESDEPDCTMLKATYEKNVPSVISSEVFWSRYFFRMYQIDQEDAARRLVLGAAQEHQDGDFSWDMEDESDTEPTGKENTEEEHTETSKTEEQNRSTTPKLSVPTTTTTTTTEEDSEWGGNSTSDPNPIPSTAVTKSGTKTGSGRNSSEGTTESFDVISAQASVDENLVKESKEKEKIEKGDDDEDSDWE